MEEDGRAVSRDSQLIGSNLTPEQDGSRESVAVLCLEILLRLEEIFASADGSQSCFTKQTCPIKFLRQIALSLADAIILL